MNGQFTHTESQLYSAMYHCKSNDLNNAVGYPRTIRAARVLGLQWKAHHSTTPRSAL